MNTRLTLIAITSLAAAAAFAQAPNIPSELRTSTAGAGCTATGNAMRGGNLGGTAMQKPCGDGAAPVAVAPEQAAVAAAPAPVSESTSMGSGRAMRPARADRN